MDQFDRLQRPMSEPAKLRSHLDFIQEGITLDWARMAEERMTTEERVALCFQVSGCVQALSELLGRLEALNTDRPQTSCP
jgi:hypothetical protein